METSSPLAAMHPPAHPSFGHPDLYRTSPARGSGTLFRMPKGKPDYFNVKALRGSSPAASLAADLSQNFRIDSDMSPQFPTPRRALFTTTTIMGGLEGREYQTTPPLPPSSSPSCMDMDISPLPQHKGAYVAQIEIHSPTPVPSPDDDEDMMLESPAPIVRQSSTDGLKPPVADSRSRRPNLRRPSLSRAKMYSTSAIPNRLHPESQISGFKFGGEGRPGSSSSSLSLSECFEDSPPQERRPQTATSPSANAAGAMRPKAHFSSLSGATAAKNGSPIHSHGRRPSNPFLRPRKQYRRSLSMFENAGDLVKTKDECAAPCTLQSVMDFEEQGEPKLPHVMPEDETDTIPRICRSTLLDVLDGKYNEHFDNKLIIDCRFEYEFEGGHIDGAMNFNDKDLLLSQLFEQPAQGRTLLVLHCEYSAHRAPLMAKHIRSEDRAANAEFYPRLSYPEVYILEGGYRAFFSEHRERCYPQAYVEMEAAEHVHTCERELSRIRQARKGLNRAHTFAFGQRERSVIESPTGPSREDDCDSSPMKLGDSPSFGHERGHARRMASY